MVPGQPQVVNQSVLTVRFYILSESGAVINVTAVSQILNNTLPALAAALNQTQVLLAGKELKVESIRLCSIRLSQIKLMRSWTFESNKFATDLLSSSSGARLEQLRISAPKRF